MVAAEVGEVDEEGEAEGEEDEDLDDEAPIIKRSEAIIHMVEVEMEVAEAEEGLVHQRLVP